MLQKLNDNTNVIFKETKEKEGIESAFTFKDGDILVFKNNIHSTLFDRRDFHSKLELYSIGSLYCFCYLNEEEFVSIKREYIEFYKFLDDRTKILEIQRINAFPSFEFHKIIKLSNNDLINLICINLERKLQIFQKKDGKYSWSEEIKEPNKDVDEIVDLGNNEMLTKKMDNCKDQLILKVYRTTDYEKLREHTVDLVFEGRRRIYFTLPLLKVKNKNKIIGVGMFKFFILDTIDLHIETMIKFDKHVIDLIQLNNGDLMLMTLIKGNFLHDEKENDKYFFDKVKIDFDLNNMISEENMEIQDNFCSYKTLTKIGNYINNGLIVITDNSEIKIFREC